MNVSIIGVFRSNIATLMREPPMTIKDWIEKYVADSVLAAGLSWAPGDGDDLLQILDSLQVLRMMLELEKQFAIPIDNADFTPENLGSIERLAALVARKQAERARLPASLAVAAHVEPSGSVAGRAV
jgi:hypothetical protein